MDKTRDKALDFLKGICISLVVYAHLPMEGSLQGSLQAFAALIYTFHIQVFILITGVLFSRKLDDGTQGVVKVANRMLKPYFVVAPINMLLYYAASMCGLKTTNTLNGGIHDALTNILLGNGGGALWYLYTFGLMEILMLLFGLLSWEDKKGKVVLQCLLSGLVFFLLRKVGLQVFVGWTPFFFLGVVLGLAFDRLPRNVFCLILAPIAYFVVGGKFEHFTIHFVYVLLIAFGILGLGELVKERMVGRIGAFLGRHSLVILLFHPMVTTVVRLLARYILMIDESGILLSVIICIVDIVCCLAIEFILRLLHLQRIIL